MTSAATRIEHAFAATSSLLAEVWEDSDTPLVSSAELLSCTIIIALLLQRCFFMARHGRGTSATAAKNAAGPSPAAIGAADAGRPSQAAVSAVGGAVAQHAVNMIAHERCRAAARRRRREALVHGLHRWFDSASTLAVIRQSLRPLPDAGLRERHYVHATIATVWHAWRAHQLQAVLSLAEETARLDELIALRPDPPPRLQLATGCSAAMGMHLGSYSAEALPTTRPHRRVADVCAEQQEWCAHASALTNACLRSRGRQYSLLVASLRSQAAASRAHLAASRLHLELRRRLATWRAEAASRRYLTHRLHGLMRARPLSGLRTSSEAFEAFEAWSDTLDQRELEVCLTRSHARRCALRHRVRLWREQATILSADCMRRSDARARGRRRVLRHSIITWRDHSRSPRGEWVWAAARGQERRLALRRRWRQWEMWTYQMMAYDAQWGRAMVKLSSMRLSARWCMWRAQGRARALSILLAERGSKRLTARRMTEAFLFWAWRARDERTTHHSPVVHRQAMETAGRRGEDRARRSSLELWRTRAAIFVRLDDTSASASELLPRVGMRRVIKTWFAAAIGIDLWKRHLHFVSLSMRHRRVRHTFHSWRLRGEESSRTHRRLSGIVRIHRPRHADLQRRFNRWADDASKRSSIRRLTRHGQSVQHWWRLRVAYNAWLSTIIGTVSARMTAAASAATARTKKLSLAFGALLDLQHHAVTNALRHLSARRLHVRICRCRAMRRLQGVVANVRAVQRQVKHRLIPCLLRKWAMGVAIKHRHQRFVAQYAPYRMRATVAHAAVLVARWRRAAKAARALCAEQILLESVYTHATPHAHSSAIEQQRSSLGASKQMHGTPIPMGELMTTPRPPKSTPKEITSGASNPGGASARRHAANGANGSPVLYSPNPSNDHTNYRRPNSARMATVAVTTPVVSVRASSSRRQPATQPPPSRAALTSFLREKPLALARREEVRATRRADAVAEGRVGGWAQSLRHGMYAGAAPLSGWTVSPG